MKKNNRFVISIFFIFALLTFCSGLLKQKDNNVLETFQNINISNKQYVYPLGNIVGIKADTDGALVIGFEEEDIEYIGGLKIGDNIISIEGEKINNYKDIANILNKLRSDEVEIMFERNNKFKKCKIKTKKENHRYKLGLWVRDKISGIGTLTCYNPITNEFYAIGHGICDMDTEKLINIKEGNIYNTSNISIYKNNEKNIGQINAIIDYSNSVGKFSINSNNGIKGNFYNYNYKFNLPLIEIGKKNDVKTGSAYVLFQSKEGNVESYEIKIEKIIKEDNNMLIKVVDDKLIDYTGGIVKGMSGAPIIQNNKLIGSLTYVFKHNPKKGYGIFIDEMLKL
ncbi:SpoIVB peptidase S55 domain-containing protein [Terrisporobacter glycolicus]|uniref:SpoIVB peptidase n=1 Tax=Terrisporobacter glycolicus ATCC 14880 = DSM 1288 TaxID=1121315 RepID=A0ABZ2EX07_9FIRM|nr:SpoIVB peptidase S55 domain-containing protein [Terrisporobacter glycolicus]